MIRVLLLSSTTGIFARRCYTKLFFAQGVSLSFLLLFVISRPYRRFTHTLMQTVAMVVPILSGTWALAGGWEREQNQMRAIFAGDDETSNEEDVAYDSTAVIALHSVLFIPPILVAMFTVCSSAWILTRKRTDEVAVTTATKTQSVLEKEMKKKKKRKLRKRRKIARQEAKKPKPQSFDSWSSWSSSSSPPGGDGVGRGATPEAVAKPKPVQPAPIAGAATAPASIVLHGSRRKKKKHGSAASIAIALRNSRKKRKKKGSIGVAPLGRSSVSSGPTGSHLPRCRTKSTMSARSVSSTKRSSVDRHRRRQSRANSMKRAQYIADQVQGAALGRRHGKKRKRKRAKIKKKKSKHHAGRRRRRRRGGKTVKTNALTSIVEGGGDDGPDDGRSSPPAAREDSPVSTAGTNALIVATKTKVAVRLWRKRAKLHRVKKQKERERRREKSDTDRYLII